ncbi:MAG: nitrogenase component 1 [Lachnospiraceae bacterium]|nr:nitrogenase component 1 [Lachnospiraceae bacterium]
MGLCRFYPSPSDRMAIIWSLMPIKDAVVLEYGPAGTTHFGGGLYSSLGIELGKTLFTTHISEDDVIMGDVSRLENAIREIDTAYHPKVIFVVAAAVIAVIGTDIAGVCQYMQEEVDARLISFEEGGFRGDYTYGLRSVYRMLANEIVKVSDEKCSTYNILGASAGSYRIRSDVWEIRNLMREAFDMECGCCMGLEGTIEDIENIGKGTINIVLRNEALECANIISEKCGVGFVYGQPYGYIGTLKWLEKIAEKIGKTINPQLVVRLKDKAMKIAPMGGPMGMGMMGHSKPKAVIQGDYDTLLGFKSALNELDIDAAQLICSHSIKDTKDADSSVDYIPKEKERIDLFKTFQKTWCLGSDEMERFTKDSNYFTCISSPFVSKTQWATHMPFMGEKGMDYLIELKNDFFSKYEY